MLKIILNLILINIIIVGITDMTDWPSTMKKALTYILTKGKITTDNYRFHLFDCSLCLVFWASLVYLIISGNINILLIAICVLSALFTNETYNLILLSKDTLDTIISLINKLLKLINKK